MVVAGIEVTKCTELRGCRAVDFEESLQNGRRIGNGPGRKDGEKDNDDGGATDKPAQHVMTRSKCQTGRVSASRAPSTARLASSELSASAVTWPILRPGRGVDLP